MTNNTPEALVELLPCPIGHSLPVIHFDGEFEAYFVKCRADGCNWRIWGNTEAEAITAWNTRPSPARDAVTDGEGVEHVANHLRVEVANAIANADLDGPDPEDYWDYLAQAAINKIAALSPPPTGQCAEAEVDREAVLEEAAKVAQVASETAPARSHAHASWKAASDEAERIATAILALKATPANPTEEPQS